jgi:hypothetical protein
MVPVLLGCHYSFMNMTSFRLPYIGDSQPEASPSWHDSTFICALTDSERHLGHAIKSDLWHAFDAIHPNSASTGFCYLGAFEELSDAKTAIEAAVLRAREPSPEEVKMKSAGASGSALY